jgi:peroxiredoxin
MKRIPALLLAGFTVLSARADLIIQQKVESAMQNGTMTMQIKGDKVRVDMPAGPMGAMSTIMDLKAGDSVVLMHQQKIALQISAAQLKQTMAAMKKLLDKDNAVNGSPKPQATGKVEKIGDYQTEIYTWANTNGLSETLWVAKDFPNYRQINAQLQKLNESSAASMVKGLGPELGTLPGMVVKSQAEVLGQKVVTTLVSAKVESIDPSAFAVPADYREMTQPTATAEVKQLEGAAEKARAALAVGTIFPDFSERDLDGKPLSLAGYRGKVVLLDFWATWCGPCVGELPNVLKTYAKYHSQGFEIIGVSLDDDRTKLLDFLKQKGMSWPQFFDGKGWKNELAVKYGIESIPATFLLDSQGKIIAADLRGEALEQAVGKALAGH